MTTTMLSTAVVISEPMFSDAERVALSGYLAGYSGLTREAYALDLRQFATWCEEHNLRLFEARRADIECFGRDLEERGRARATVARRLCAVAGFYRCAVEEELLEHFEVNTGWRSQVISQPTRLRAFRVPDPPVEQSFENFKPFDVEPTA
jgi:hypothetical protein